MPSYKSFTIKADTGKLTNHLRFIKGLKAKPRKEGQSDKERKADEHHLEQGHKAVEAAFKQLVDACDVGKDNVGQACTYIVQCQTKAKQAMDGLTALQARLEKNWDDAAALQAAEAARVIQDVHAEMLADDAALKRAGFDQFRDDAWRKALNEAVEVLPGLDGKRTRNELEAQRILRTHITAAGARDRVAEYITRSKVVVQAINALRGKAAAKGTGDPKAAAEIRADLQALEKEVAPMKDQAVTKHLTIYRKCDELLTARPALHANLEKADDLIGHAILLHKELKGRHKTSVIQLAELAKRAEAASLDIKSETGRVAKMLAAFSEELDRIKEMNGSLASRLTSLQGGGAAT